MQFLMVIDSVAKKKKTNLKLKVKKKILVKIKLLLKKTLKSKYNDPDN